MPEGELKLRLIRRGDSPATNPLAEAFEFGLQDAKGAVHPGRLDAGGLLAWDFSVRVRRSADGSPNFLGPFASGPAGDRFVYLSWRSLARGVWINRIKARLGSITWAMIDAAQACGRPLQADMTDWTPHDARRSVTWRPS